MLNGLATDLDDMPSGATGLRFVAQDDGSGLHCLYGAGDLPGRIGERCRAAPARISSVDITKHACGRRSRIACLVPRGSADGCAANRLVQSEPVVQGPVFFDGFFGSAYDG